MTQMKERGCFPSVEIEKKYTCTFRIRNVPSSSILLEDIDILQRSILRCDNRGTFAGGGGDHGSRSRFTDGDRRSTVEQVESRGNAVGQSNAPPSCRRQKSTVVNYFTHDPRPDGSPAADQSSRDLRRSLTRSIVRATLALCDSLASIGSVQRDTSRQQVADSSASRKDFSRRMSRTHTNKTRISRLGHYCPHCGL